MLNDTKFNSLFGEFISNIGVGDVRVCMGFWDSEVMGGFFNMEYGVKDEKFVMMAVLQRCDGECGCGIHI